MSTENKTVVIEQNIPIPPVETKGKWKEVMKVMKIGDSFQFHGSSGTVSSAAIAVGIKGTVRRLGPKHYRFWRME
jgi:hypothetical protein